MKSKKTNRLNDYNKCSKKKCEKIISEKDLNKMFKLSKNKESKDYFRLRIKKDKCISKKCTHLIKGQLKRTKPNKKELNNFRNMFNRIAA